NLDEANRQRSTARKAVDEMYTQAAQKLVAGEGRLTQLQREFLEKALAFYQDFAAQKGDDPADQAELAEAALRVGDIRSSLGRFEEAIASYQQAGRVLRHLAEVQPDAAVHQLALAE